MTTSRSYGLLCAGTRKDGEGRVLSLDLLTCEHVLHRLIGSAAVMAEQCAHLADMAERPQVALHVVPEGTNVGLWGAFDIAARDGTATVRLSALEDVTGTALNLVDKALQAYERILGAAMPRVESYERIRTAEEQWKTQQT
jgi:hypothetical protein